MADGFSTSLLFRKPEPNANQNAWGPLLNEDFGSDRIEQAIVGMASYALTADKTLTRVNGETDEARMRVQNITSADSARQITIPAVPIWYWFRNGSAFDHTVTNGSNSVAVKAGNGVPIVSDGVDIFQLRCMDFGADLPKSTGLATEPSQFATKGYVDAQAFSSALPGQAGNASKYLRTDGAVASWQGLFAADIVAGLGYTPTSVTGLTGSQSVSAFKSGLSLNNVENKSSATIRGEFAAAPNAFSAKQSLMASVAGAASLAILPGTAPTTPANGDIWETSAGLFARINGATLQLNGFQQIGATQVVTGLSNLSLTGFGPPYTDMLILFSNVRPTSGTSVSDFAYQVAGNLGTGMPAKILTASILTGFPHSGVIYVPGAALAFSRAFGSIAYDPAQAGAVADSPVMLSGGAVGINFTVNGASDPFGGNFTMYGR